MILNEVKIFLLFEVFVLKLFIISILFDLVRVVFIYWDFAHELLLDISVSLLLILSMMSL